MQNRPEKHGKIFKLIKFKTMSYKRNAQGNLMPDADRLTNIGESCKKYLFRRITPIN
jgi:undecaprenyl phosphate N,N'-diacetylbacillosamine 1-phosphate transferase